MITDTERAMDRVFLILNLSRLLVEGALEDPDTETRPRCPREVSSMVSDDALGCKSSKAKKNCYMLKTLDGSKLPVPVAGSLISFARQSSGGVNRHDHDLRSVRR